MLSKTLGIRPFPVCMLFGVLVCAFLVSQQALASGLLPSSKLKLNDFQLKTIKSDLPATDILLGSDQAIWIVGKSNIWQWMPKLGSLKRIRINKNTNPSQQHRLKIVGSDGAQLFAASDRSLYQIKFSPLKVFKYKKPGEQLGVSLGYGGFGDKTWWLHTDGFYQLDRYSRKISRKHDLNFLKATDKIVALPAKKILWIARGNKLYLHKIGGKKQQPRLIESFPQKISKIQLVGNEVFVQTKYTLKRYQTSGKLLQTIPVFGKRRLLAGSYSSKEHAYLFSDSLLEVHQLGEKKTRRYRLDLGSKKTISSLAVFGESAAIISNGEPIAFKLTKVNQQVARKAKRKQ